MHSKKKVIDKFGLKFSQILPFMYGSYHESHGRDSKVNLKLIHEISMHDLSRLILQILKSYSFGEFFNETFKQGETALRRNLTSISFRDFVMETR